ncbi:MAG: hypothetical protein HGA75_05470 [Thiobacillus sp.]|nr:hypothetical protein [Thiobacillus sp.]
MKRATRILALALVAVLLASCAAWTRLDGTSRLTGPDGLSAMAPAGWMRFNLVDDRVIALTRDGLQIQTLRIEYRKHDKAFPGVKKPSNADMLPTEAAELLLADLKADKGLANIKLIENVPCRLAGKPGFRLHGEYRDERGAQFDLVAIGRVTQVGLAVVFYRALSTHYYPRDLKLFEQVADSLTL